MQNDQPRGESPADKEWSEDKVRVGDTELVTVKGGKGKPLLVLHGELGWPGWTPVPERTWGASASGSQRGW